MNEPPAAKRPPNNESPEVFPPSYRLTHHLSQTRVFHRRLPRPMKNQLQPRQSMKLKESKIDLRTGTFPAIFGCLFTSVVIGPASATDITGDTVTGDLTVEGDSVAVTNGLSEGFELRFDGTRADFWHDATREWVWSFGSTPTEVMSLGTNNVLSLYHGDPTLADPPTIVLDPGDPSAQPAIDPAIYIDDSEAVTVANAPDLLGGSGGSFVARSSDNQGSEDSLLLEGSLGGSGGIPAQGMPHSVTRMMWYPEKSVFRAGYANLPDFEWSELNVGEYSTAFGLNAGASGPASFSAGEEVLASGDHAVAMGYQSEATGDNSVAMGGSSIANGSHSLAAGLWSHASGFNSSAFSGSYVSAYQAVGFGPSMASGDYSSSFGGGSASGMASTAFGGTSAYGNYSATFGDWGMRATSFASLALGRYNEDFHDDTDATTIEAAETSWQGDRQHSAFEVGIGQSSSARRNGLTVFQDGSVELGKSPADVGNEDDVPLTIEADGSVILAKPQGDISMGIYQ